jgi:hypothetical protein
MQLNLMFWYYEYLIHKEHKRKEKKRKEKKRKDFQEYHDMAWSYTTC